VLREPIFVSGQECFVTASVGVAMFPRDGASVVDLLRNSDVAMYSAKAQGKNASAIYSPQLAGRGRDKLELETALHKAIERDELVLHYQPKIDVRSARMVGAEALMRWQRGGELVPPGGFHPAGRGHRPDRAAVRMGAARGGAPGPVWQVAFGFTDSIAVNLPSRLFERSDLVEHIHQCVTQFGVPHRVIQLEITEDNLMKDLQNVIPSLHRLNEIGVEISIDDFGTGYSSLAYLTTLPISELKIDRSFVRDLGITPQSSAVVTAIIALARSLGLRVVAEGVENAAPDGSAAPPGLHRDAGLPVQPGCRPTTCSAGWNRPCCRARRRGSAGRRSRRDSAGRRRAPAAGPRARPRRRGSRSPPSGMPPLDPGTPAESLPPRWPRGAAPPRPGSARAHAGELRPRLCGGIRPAAGSSTSRGSA
jgi:predicted signal transduction protein with EAL and GGDEF domain